LRADSACAGPELRADSACAGPGSAGCEGTARARVPRQGS
jgi:hypothetical protein